LKSKEDLELLNKYWVLNSISVTPIGNSLFAVHSIVTEAAIGFLKSYPINFNKFIMDCFCWAVVKKFSLTAKSILVANWSVIQANNSINNFT